MLNRKCAHLNRYSNVQPGAATGRDGRCADQISGQPRRPDAFFYVTLVARDVWHLGGVALLEVAARPAAGAARAPQPHALCPLKCAYG
jgi:hypothetical protein